MLFEPSTPGIAFVSNEDGKVFLRDKNKIHSTITQRMKLTPDEKKLLGPIVEKSNGVYVMRTPRNVVEKVSIDPLYFRFPEGIKCYPKRSVVGLEIQTPIKKDLNIKSLQYAFIQFISNTGKSFINLDKITFSTTNKPSIINVTVYDSKLWIFIRELQCQIKGIKLSGVQGVPFQDKNENNLPVQIEERLKVIKGKIKKNTTSIESNQVSISSNEIKIKENETQLKKLERKGDSLSKKVDDGFADNAIKLSKILRLLERKSSVPIQDNPDHDTLLRDELIEKRVNPPKPRRVTQSTEEHENFPDHELNKPDEQKVHSDSLEQSLSDENMFTDSPMENSKHVKNDEVVPSSQPENAFKLSSQVVQGTQNDPVLIEDEKLKKRVPYIKNLEVGNVEERRKQTVSKKKAKGLDKKKKKKKDQPTDNEKQLTIRQSFSRSGQEGTGGDQ